MWLVFTDLDGTLLDHATYSFDAARPALARLAERGIPLVPCTSKTRAEVAALRRRLGARDPYIVENGGAVIVPAATGLAAPEGAVREGAEWVLALAAPRAEVVAALRAAARATGAPVRLMSDMDVQAVRAATGLDAAAAAAALARRFGEPFLVDDPAAVPPLRTALAGAGFRWQSGGRFHHLSRGSDKGRAAALVADLYRRGGTPVRTVGLGDAPNDVPLLRAVDVPVIVRSPRAAEVSALVPGAAVTAAEGPAGWNAAVLALLDGGA